MNVLHILARLPLPAITPGIASSNTNPRAPPRAHSIQLYRPCHATNTCTYFTRLSLSGLLRQLALRRESTPVDSVHEPESTGFT